MPANWPRLAEAGAPRASPELDLAQVGRVGRRLRATVSLFSLLFSTQVVRGLHATLGDGIDGGAAGH